MRSLPIFFDWVRTWRYRLSLAATPTPRRSFCDSVSSELCNTARAFYEFRSGCRLTLSQSAALTASLCSSDPAAERLRLDVVGACTLAVHLDDRDPLAVPRFQLRVAVDRHLVELETELVSERVELRLGALAEGAA